MPLLPLLLLAAVLQAASTAPAADSAGCPGPGAFQAATQLASDARKGGSTAAAKAQIDPLVAACAPATPSGYVARLLRAELAVREKDWRVARTTLAPLDLAQPTPLAATLAFLRMAADKGAGDAAAFTRDRDAALAANEAGLLTRGRKLETFTAGPYSVASYDAVVDQPPFRRLTEFVATPADGGAYPVTVMLTDDLTADKMMSEMAAKDGKPAQRVLFVDLYECGRHSTLQQIPGGADGAAPPYAAVKAQVAQALASPAPGAKASSSMTPAAQPGGVCQTARWLAPGLGLRAGPPPAG